jgi:hypothetical protein
MLCEDKADTVLDDGLEQELTSFSIMGWIVSIGTSVGQMVSVAATPFCYPEVKVALGNTYVNGYNCEPKILLTKPGGGLGLVTVCSLYISVRWQCRVRRKERNREYDMLGSVGKGSCSFLTA